MKKIECYKIDKHKGLKGASILLAPMCLNYSSISKAVLCLRSSPSSVVAETHQYFMNRQIMKYFKIIILCFLIASVFSLIGVLVLQSTGLIGKADSDFKNLPYGIAINLCFFLSSFTILLNLKEQVSTNNKYRAMSFFLLPAVFVLFVLFAMWDQPWPGVLFCVPYLIVLFIFFLRSKKEA
jgi:peptidoglycan/LPS O-acetylase OafA/YrhL